MFFKYLWEYLQYVDFKLLYYILAVVMAHSVMKWNHTRAISVVYHRLSW